MKTDAFSSEQDYDVVIIGGGPAGTTAASLLAEKGWSVCVLEKDRHPRFHVGESLLPMNLPIFERLGVLPAVEEIGIRKYAAEFNSTQTANSRDIFYFSKAVKPDHAYAFEVRRSEFDELLFNNCQAKGATALQGMRVRSVDLGEARQKTVVAEDENGEQSAYRCRYVIDASGRDTFLANKLQSKQRNAKHNMAAIFCHFRNVERRPGDDEGNISIYWFQHGWMWMIPLKDGAMSVGAVCWPEYLRTRNGPLQQFFLDTVALIPEAAERMQHAEAAAEIQATGNYSYSSSVIAGEGYVLIGDAYAFVDPVFSSGIYLAMRSAIDAAELADSVLRDPCREKQQIKLFEKRVKHGIREFSWFIYRFNTPVLHRLLMSADEQNLTVWKRKMRAAVISVLAGDVYDNPALRLPLTLFKAVYYVMSLFNPGEMLRFKYFKAQQNRIE